MHRTKGDRFVRANVLPVCDNEEFMIFFAIFRLWIVSCWCSRSKASYCMHQRVWHHYWAIYRWVKFLWCVGGGGGVRKQVYFFWSVLNLNFGGGDGGGGNLSDQIFMLPAEGYKSSDAPNFEIVEGAHCFGLVRSLVVGPLVSLSVQKEIRNLGFWNFINGFLTQK